MTAKAKTRANAGSPPYRGLTLYVISIADLVYLYSSFCLSGVLKGVKPLYVMLVIYLRRAVETGQNSSINSNIALMYCEVSFWASFETLNV